MRPATLIAAFAYGRIAFGLASALAPASTGRILAGDGGAAPDARAFLRGIGGREIGLGLGLLGAASAGLPVSPWLTACVIADSSDVAGMASVWHEMDPAKRLPGVVFAGMVGVTGLVLLATDRAQRGSRI